MKRPEAFPRLMRAFGEAGRLAYSQIPVTISGHAMALAAAGHRSLSASPSISDHHYRIAKVLEQALRDPAVRKELRDLLDSYELHAPPA